MTILVAQHRGADPNDEHVLVGQWHVGRLWPGLFPDIEQNCPCPVAPCGLAAPVADIACDQHKGSLIIRQTHAANECHKHRRTWRRAKTFALLRK